MARRERVRRGPVATLGTALCWVGVAVALPLGLILIGVSMI